MEHPLAQQTGEVFNARVIAGAAGSELPGLFRQRGQTVGETRDQRDGVRFGRREGKVAVEAFPAKAVDQLGVSTAGQRELLGSAALAEEDGVGR